MDPSPNGREPLLHGQSFKRQTSDMNDSATSSLQHTLPHSLANSQESSYTSSPDQPVASPESDRSSATDHAAPTSRITFSRPDDRPDGSDGSDKLNHLLHLSTIAAAQDRLALDPASTTRRWSPDGELGALTGGVSSMSSMSSRASARGHARNPSAVSVASTTASTIGELSAELKTRLSYAMVKVNLGLQARSINEVECLASQAASTPPVVLDPASAQGNPLAYDARLLRRKSDSPLPNALADKSTTLAPPASIQATLSTTTPRLHPRRNSTPRHAALLHSYSASPHTPGHPLPPTSHQISSSQPESTYYSSQTRNAREQDAVETLLFMSSPNNSANLKHAFSPAASPDPSQLPAKVSMSTSTTSTTSTASSGTTTKPGPTGAPRKSLPSHRPTPAAHKRIDKSSGMLHPLDPSAMALDSAQHSYHSPNRVTPRRRVRGNSAGLRSSLSLPVALGGGHSGARRALRDEDIERMLDRVAAETADSSDDEDIQIPRLKNGVADAMGIRS